MFKATILADSISNVGKRLTTMCIEYPRFIHAEFMTHRVFGRCASSSRAIPVERFVDAVCENPAQFVHIGSNRPGMQATDEVDQETKDKFNREWRELADHVSTCVLRWANDYGIHKQVANRALEPWHHIKVVVTSTEWDNFWALRCHPDAQPEMRTLAETMHKEYQLSVPQTLAPGEWHLPYVSSDELQNIGITNAIKCSVARCARTSYNNHDGTTPSLVKDLNLYERLVGSVPWHASPTEHQGTPDFQDNDSVWDKPELHGNLVGFVQYRKLIEQGYTITCAEGKP